MNDTLDLLMSTARERRHAPSAFRREYHPSAEQSQEIIERLYPGQSEASTLAPELPPISIPPAYEDECDVLVKIPMAGRADSLNAAIAAAVMAFQVKASWRDR